MTPHWRNKELTIWKPPDLLTISEWAEKYRVLGPPSEEKGPLRLRRTPYMVPIMNTCLMPSVETIVLCKSAQVAGTEGMISILGYFSHQDPCPIMLILADEDTAIYMSTSRIRPMYENSPDLYPLVIPQEFTQKEITLANQTYIAMGWASSVAKLGSRPIKIVIFDEVDKPGYYVSTKEAAPISLGVQRTETFFNRKIFILSTPTLEEGNISKHLASSDVIYDWHIPCPFCGQYQPLRWSRKYSTEFEEGKYRAEDGTMHNLGEVVWEGGRDATQEQIEKARYKCGECGAMWNTVQKNQAVEQGKMVARTEIDFVPRKVGFHINRLYSLLGKSGNIPKLVNDWIDCQKAGDPRELQGFLNSALAVPWVEKGIKPTENKVLERRCELPPLVVPKEAVALTAGIDVQKHGFYFTVWAFSHDLESWLIQYGFLPTWEEVYDLVFDNAYQVQGTEQETRQIWRVAMDTGGGVGEEEGGISQTEEVYSWLRDNGRNVIWGIKGDARPRGQKIRHSIIDKMPGPRGQIIRGGLVIYLLDTSQLKEDFFWRLSNSDSDPQPMHLHNETGTDFAKHILAEEKRRNKKGQWEWVVIYRENHWLDASIYAHAAADPQWAGGVRVLRALKKPKLKEPPDKPDRPSDWFGSSGGKGWLR